MKRIFFVLVLFSFLASHGYAQTLVANPQNNDKEGGELLLKNSNSNYKPWHIDNYAGSLRFFRTGQVLFDMNSSGVISKLTVDKIGIGVTNSKGKLHLNGDLYANIGEGFRLFGDINYFGKWNDGIIFEMQDSNHTLGRTDGGFVFRGFTPSDNKHTDWMVIKSGGNVGIGTKMPDKKLTVQGDVNVGGTGNGSVIARHINGKSHISPKVGELFLNYSTGYPVFVGKNDKNANFYVHGKVGIGTTTPTDELSVNGTIRSKEVVCEATSWPDYVFEKDYDLKSLADVESYISENGHLPNIPPASKIEEYGVKLGQMNVLLLEKIEELTLYTISQQKEIKKQQATIYSQENQFKNQEELIAKLMTRLDTIENKISKTNE
ncbi:hypothetical protein [uncultured Aquimarina sp.]|uniref:hypothetical protein n=1 Tax=uncultured Aquimarina sp. TaxID=575652 RepID=UPI002618FA92|nr:hypothetical protein [uncultured Aquimarina sp.]